MKLLPKIITIFIFVSIAPIAIFATLSIWGINQQRGDIPTVLTMLAAIFSVVALFFAIQFARYLTDPIMALKEAARKIREGDLSQRVDFRSRDELGELAASFNSMASRIELTDKIKSDFINLASHHLRTPNTEISWAVDELVLNTKRPTKQQKQALETILRGVQSLHDISETLLNISEAQMGNISVKKEKFDLKLLISEIVKGFQPKFDEKKVALNLELPVSSVEIESDPRLIRSALRVLLENALVYTEEGEVNVSVKNAGGRIRIAVHDTGIGIPAAQIDQLFSEFYQADNAKTVYPTGHGLGLFLARTAIRNLGGDITVESELDQGSTFTITL